MFKARSWNSELSIPKQWLTDPEGSLYLLPKKDLLKLRSGVNSKKRRKQRWEKEKLILSEILLIHHLKIIRPNALQYPRLDLGTEKDDEWENKWDLNKAWSLLSSVTNVNLSFDKCTTGMQDANIWGSQWMVYESFLFYLCNLFNKCKIIPKQKVYFKNPWLWLSFQKDIWINYENITRVRFFKLKCYRVLDRKKLLIPIND